MPKFMDFHPNTSIPPERVEQLRQETLEGRVDQYGVRQLELFHSAEGKAVYCLLEALDESAAPVNQDLPDEPEAFSLLVASALPIDNDAKQTFLEMTSTRLRLSRLRPFVTSALSDYNDRIRVQQMAKGNGHSRIRSDP